ncbi:unnamed protein product [Rangifer tarandus platyrhynchus]|uniref:Uncharacterized protein n=2 Tax=Rangifer tarandus platyrhynchus TaxID=3082113 RepID=A0ABN8YZ43_RANTA|nr:unnamed protein product [Rangifer tarandus platyrhynchus]
MEAKVSMGKWLAGQLLWQQCFNLSYPQLEGCAVALGGEVGESQLAPHQVFNSWQKSCFGTLALLLLSCVPASVILSEAVSMHIKWEGGVPLLTAGVVQRLSYGWFKGLVMAGDRY